MKYYFCSAHCLTRFKAHPEAFLKPAERDALPVAGPPSEAGVYLNRLSDLLWTMARWQESRSGPSRASRSIANPEEQQQ